MSADESFENRLREQELRSLPGQWREGILANATVGSAPAAGGAPAGRWRGVLAGLLPKPVLIPLAAGWMAIGFLWLTTPRNDAGDGPGTRSSIAADAVFSGETALVAWLEQVRALEAGIAEIEEAL